MVKDRHSQHALLRPTRSIKPPTPEPCGLRFLPQPLPGSTGNISHDFDRARRHRDPAGWPMRGTTDVRSWWVQIAGHVEMDKRPVALAACSLCLPKLMNSRPPHESLPKYVNEYLTERQAPIHVLYEATNYSPACATLTEYPQSTITISPGP